MKKRIFSLILIACLLVTGIPVLGTAVAASTEPTAYDYSSLYVGADGSETANGGKLTVLLTSYLGDSSVAEGLTAWNNIAPDATKNGTLVGTWTAKGQGGIGYDISSTDAAHQLSLDASLLPLDTYSIEIVAAVRGFTANADGITVEKTFKNDGNLWLGRLNGYLFSGDYTENRGYNGLVMVMNDTASLVGNHAYDSLASGDAFYNGISAYRNNTGIVNLGINLTKTITDEATGAGTYNYQFLNGGVEEVPYKKITSCAIDTTNTQTAHDYFILFRNMGSTMYSVRVYDKPLTAAERQQNHFADVAAFYELDLTGFDAEADNSALYNSFSSVQLDDVNYEVAKAAAQLKLDDPNETTKYSSLYVGVDGSETANGGKLTVLLLSYKGESTVSNGAKVWYNLAPGATQNAIFTGLWGDRGIGGVGHDVANHSTMNALKFEDSTILPLETYTLETVASVRGYTQGADGVTPVQMHPGTASGVGASMALGRLRTYLFSGVYTEGATAAQRSNSTILGVYDEVTTSDDWGATNIRANIYGWENGLDVYKNGTADERDTSVVSFTVNLTTSGSTYKYSFMKNGAVIKPAQGDNSVSIDDADANVENYGNFYLFNNMSPSVYSVRLYTAPLTEAERVQNHFADLVAFYELDLSEFDKDADNTLIYKMMAAVTLDETNYDAAKATAQLKLDELLAGSTFQYSKLYVGADGSETENGGKLTVLLVSFESESSAGTGSWYNIAPNATQDATFTGSWTKMGKGGIGHNVASLSDTALKFLDSSILPIDNYTIEMVASVRGYTQNADGVTEIYGGTHCRAGIALGRLRGYFMSGHTASDPKFHDKNLMIMLSDKFHANDNWDNTIIENRWTNMLTVYKGEYGIVNFGINLSTSDDTYYYRFFKNGAAMAPSSYSSIADADPNADFQGRFTLFDCMAPTAYAVRLYDATLTETERQQNHFIDVAAFYGLDLSAFKEMDAETKQFTYGLFRNVELDEKNYDAAKEEAQELLSIASMEITLNDYDKMMVGADGSATANGGHLTALFTAYNADNTLNLDKGLWIDKVHKNTAYFEGDLWQAVAGGGVGYVVTAGPKGEELGNGFYAVDTTSPYYTIDEAANDQFLRLPNSLLVGTLDYTLDVVAKVDTKFYFTDAEGNLTDEVYVNANQFVYYTATYTDEEGNPVSVENIRIASDLFEDGVAYWVTYQMGTENYARDVYNYNSETGEVGTRILFAQGAATNLTKIPDKTLVTFTETSKVYERASVFGGSDDRFFAIGIMTAYANFQNDGSWKQGTTLSYVQRVCLTLNNNTWNSTRFANGSWDDSNGRVLYDGVLHSMSYVRDIEGENQTYNIYKDGKTHFANETVFTTTTTSFPLENETTEFYLFNKTPVNVYAIRMYDVLLTAEEKAQNKAADICAYYQLDVHAYLEGTDADKAVVIEGLADAIFDEENYAAKKAEYQAVIDTIDPYKESGKPTYGGIVDGATYYVSTGFTAADPHPGILDKVEIKVGDGEYEVIEAPYTFAGNANITYTIRITDVAGNETIVTVHVKPIATLGEAIADLTVDNVKSSDKATIEAVVASITLDLTYATDDEKAALKEISDKCVALLAEIDATLAEKVRIETAVGLYTEATVKSSDSEALAQLKADIAALIATGQLTADEEAQISALITTIDALNARIAAIAEEIQRIETAIGAYTEETVKSSDTEALAQLKADIAALIATGQLTAEEVEAVGVLDDSIDALVAKIDAILAEIARIENAVGSYTNANVKSSDSEALAQLKADIAALIATNQLIAAEVEVVNALDETIDARVARIAAVADEVERITEESAAFDAATVKVSDEAAVSALTRSIMPLINNLTDEEIAEFGPVSQKLMACKAKINAVKADLAAIEAALGELTVGTVNSDAKDALVDAIAKIDALVATDNVTEAEKTALGTDKATAEALVAKIDDVKTKLDAIIAGAASYAEATVKSSDKVAITALKAGIMPLMANLTEVEIGTLVGATQKLNALVAKIDAVTAEYTRIKDAVANAETAKADLEALVIDAYELLATTNLTDAEKTEITAKKNAINVLIASLEAGALGDADADFDGVVKDSFDNAANATLNEAIQDAIEAGKEITTHIVVGKVDAADVQDDNDKIVAFLGEKGNLVQLYNYTIVVKADGVVLGEISALDEGLKLKIAIPEELLEGRRVFKVVRVHNGVVEELETEVIDGVAYFESDAFSTYALTYKDKMPIIAIIGIVVGCVAVVGIAGFFIFRKGGKKEEGQEG